MVGAVERGLGGSLACEGRPAADWRWWFIGSFNDERWRAGFYTAGETPAFPGAPRLFIVLHVSAGEVFLTSTPIPHFRGLA